MVRSKKKKRNFFSSHIFCTFTYFPVTFFYRQELEWVNMIYGNEIPIFTIVFTTFLNSFFSLGLEPKINSFFFFFFFKQAFLYLLHIEFEVGSPKLDTVPQLRSFQYQKEIKVSLRLLTEVYLPVHTSQHEILSSFILCKNLAVVGMS